jgi:septal ring factor EnvC (AmiA/AmiB activator)
LHTQPGAHLAEQTMTSPKHIEARIEETRVECAQTRDRIEHIIERLAALERKINALAEAERTRRDEIIDRIQALLELTNTKGGAE